MIVTSYPYLALSKKHNIDYGLVIDLAWLMMQGYPVRYGTVDMELVKDILSVQSQHRGIQDGRLDWRVGYMITN